MNDLPIIDQVDEEEVVQQPQPEPASDLDEVHNHLLKELNISKRRCSELENQNFILVREKRLIQYELSEARKDLEAVKLIDTKKK